MIYRPELTGEQMNLIAACLLRPPNEQIVLFNNLSRQVADQEAAAAKAKETAPELSNVDAGNSNAVTATNGSAQAEAT